MVPNAGFDEGLRRGQHVGHHGDVGIEFAHGLLGVCAPQAAELEDRQAAGLGGLAQSVEPPAFSGMQKTRDRGAGRKPRWRPCRIPCPVLAILTVVQDLDELAQRGNPRMYNTTANTFRSGGCHAMRALPRRVLMLAGVTASPGR
jgi:hypothetical protein